jgi:hypothetical protein
MHGGDFVQAKRGEPRCGRCGGALRLGDRVWAAPGPRGHFSPDLGDWTVAHVGCVSDEEHAFLGGREARDVVSRDVAAADSA